ncbi:hypothetical protein [Mucilaginibacter ginkgonis]|uniref:Lipocalin-like protein n=1 Tax=Mucilaginibacter ginkgonis TaxID=2682091 RepID=A0A6I4I0I9_9SPHI|nr:hypothetical protein [Mucilaginibacter ginkgonis]QQL50999.1 hypothetical protein GO620_005990 [Mucilaginibacter ginkgonis]
MKSLLYSFVVLLLTVSSCKKSDSLADIILGKWQLFASVNVSASSVDPATTYLYVKFNSDGSLGGNLYPNFTNYQFNANNGTITFTGNGSSILYNYSFVNSQLNLSLPNTLTTNYLRFKKVP